MNDFFGSTTFKFSKIIGTRDDRKPRALGLEHNCNDDEYCNNEKNRRHMCAKDKENTIYLFRGRYISIKVRALYEGIIFLQILVLFGFFIFLWYNFSIFRQRPF